MCWCRAEHRELETKSVAVKSENNDKTAHKGSAGLSVI